jgi:hypothetical protein
MKPFGEALEATLVRPSADIALAAPPLALGAQIRRVRALHRR